MRRPATVGIVLVLLAAGDLAADEPPRVVPARTDHHGDPLPPGILARFGTLRFRTHSGVTELALSPDGKVLAERVDRDSIYFFETATGKLLHRVHFNKVPGSNEGAAPIRLTFRPDGKSLLYGIPKVLPLQEIDVRTGHQRSVPLPLGSVCLSLTPDARFGVLCQDLWKGKCRLDVYDFQSGKSIRGVELSLTGNDRNVLAAVSPDGRFLARLRHGSESQPPRIEIRDVRSGKDDSSPIPDETISKLGFNAASTELFALMETGVLHFDLPTPTTPKFRLRAKYAYPFPNGLDQFILSPDERHLLMCGTESVVTIWDMKSNRLVRNWHTHSYGLTDLDFTRDGKTLITTSEFECVPRFWDYETATDRNPLRGHRDRVSGLQFDPSGQELISASDDGSIRVWDLRPMRTPIPNRTRPLAEVRYRGTEKQILCETIAVFTGLWLTEDGRKLFAYKQDEGVYGWERASGKKGTLRLPINSNDSRPAAMSPGGRFVARIQDGGGTPVFSLNGDRVFGVGDGHSKYTSVGFHPDDRTVLLANQTGECELWDVLTGKRVRSGRMPDPDRPLRERYVLVQSGASDGFVWNRTTGRPLGAIGNCDDSVALSPNGRYVVKPAGEGIQLSDVLTGQGITWPGVPRTAPQITYLQFSPNSLQLAIGSRDGLIELFDLRPPPTDAKPTEETFAKAWANLLHTDLTEVRKAMGVFLSAPAESIPWLTKKIAIPKGLDPNEVTTLLNRLDHPQFRVRERATEHLRGLGDAIEPRIEALEIDPPSEEVGNRCRSLLKSLSTVDVKGNRLRFLRVVEILEAVGTAEAKRALEKSFTKDDRFLWLSARDALERLGR